MFKRANLKPSNDWELSVSHPDIMLDDVSPLPSSQGDVSSLPLAYQTPVHYSFVKTIRKAAYEQQNGTLAWFNARLAPSIRLNSLVEFTSLCKPNEMVWLFSRFREIIFDILHQSFLNEIEFLNSLHERILSPTTAAMAELWTSLMCLHRLFELLPRVFASGWRQDEIENMLLVVLDHGNNPDVRALGFYTLCLYMVSLGDNYSETTIDLFTNAISLRAFSYIDMPAASDVVGKLMCAIASGADVAEIGCGQRAIIGFPPGRASICPVLQDTAQTINPQGILSLRMMRDVLSLVSYLASLVPGPTEAYTEYIGLGFIGAQSTPFDFINQRQGTTASLPPFVPMLALSCEEILKSMQSIHRLFRRGYFSWIYPNSEDPFRGNCVRRVPILALRLLVITAMESLVPQHSNMMVDNEFSMPYTSKNPQDCCSSLNKHPQDAQRSLISDASPLHARAYATLRLTSLDQDVKCAGFLIGVMRLSLLAPQYLDNCKPGEDILDMSVLEQAGYEACLGALTIIRLWLASKEEYRPLHLLAINDDTGSPTSIISDYLDCVYDLLDWLVSDTSWDEKKCLISGWLFLGGPVAEVASQCKSLYGTRTVWTIHLNVWCNVLRALTIARGRHILKVDERILIQESMFSGQRQRKGLSKADMYTNSLLMPTHHLEVDSSSDSLETATPFNFTSKLTWDSMRMVFAKQQQAAQEEQKSKTACIQSVLGSDDGFVSAMKNNQLTPRLKTTNSVYVLVAVSGSRNLHPLGDSVPSDLFKEAFLQDETPPRVLRNYTYLQQRPELNRTRIPTSTSAGTASNSCMNSSSFEESRFKSRPALDSEDSATSTGVWKKLTTPFRRKASMRSQNEAPGHSAALDGAQLVIPPASAGLANPSLGEFTQCRSSLPRHTNESAMLRTQAKQQLPTPSKDEETAELVRSPESMVSMQLQFRSSRPSAIGPAKLKANRSRRSVVSKHIHHQAKSATRGVDVGVQKSQIARLNSAAAISFLDTLMTRIWQFEAVWTDFHISEFVGSQDNPVKDLQKLWLVWVDLLGSPVKAQGVKSEIILRGLINSWDVYRAVLDCSRYTPDNDDVLLNTSWWVAEMATSFSSLLSLGISGARMLMYSLDKGLRRLLLENSSYDGIFPEPAICGAVKLLVSMATILSSGRVLNANHVNLKIRPLTDSNMTSTAEYNSELGSVVDSLEKTAYPTIVDPLATREYSITLKEGGPIFGRSCETMYRILLDNNCLKYYILVLQDMVNLLLTIITKAPELITDADTLPAETSAKSIRDFFVEKIIHNCAHPTSPEAMCGHQYNRALVVTDTGSGVVLSLTSTAYVDDHEEKTVVAPSFTTPDSGFEYTHIDSSVLEDFSSDRVFFFSHGNSILKIYNEPGTPFCRSITRGCTGKRAVRAHFTPEKSENSYKPKHLSTSTELPCKVVSDESEVYAYGSKRRHIPVISALATDAGKQFQDRLLQDSGGGTSSASSGSGQHLGGLGISNAALTEKISTFVAAEAQACNDARPYYSESDSSDEGDGSGSVASTECKIDPSRLRVFSNGLRNEDSLSPLKMDLFRNLIQHKLVYSARKTTVNYYVPLVKSESLFRDIRALDRIHARETIKVAVLYVGPGQWSEAEILSNSFLDTSRSYRSFVDSLGWQVDLATFQGFTGKLESNGSDGESCPYYADESIEVAFHEAAAMPKDQKDVRQTKKDISAVQVVDNMFGAAIYDTIVHQLSVMCVTQQQPTSKLALQSLIKQTLADVVLHPQGNTFDGNVGSMLSELSSFDVKFREIVPVGIEAFDFVSAEKRLFGLTENMAAAAKESIELDERINEGFEKFYARRCKDARASVTYLAMDMHSKVLDEMCGVLSKVKSIKVACLRIQTELLLADLESLAQFAYAIVKLHGLVTSMTALGAMIIDSVDFDTSRLDERIVIASGVSSKVDHLREKFSKLDDLLGEASCKMEAEAGVPVVAVYFPQLGFLSSVDSNLTGSHQLMPHLDDWNLKFQTDKQRYYKNSITQLLDRSPGDIFSLIVDAESEVSLELQNNMCSYIRDIIQALELASQLDCHLDVSHGQLQRTVVLVGPNASGKSVLLKQIALIVYMAHIGSPVPAKSAVVGLTDRVLAMGKTTESLSRKMSALSADLSAVAKITELASTNSLVLLDEFGRGTAPVDGVSLLCGVLASLSLRNDNRPSVLAATHFQGK
ncbi:hypothetical protein GGH93_002546 [Coemansia aciculifera]|nr:hypothetical protein GGH93_002546 [Coemansia aciculifera]